MFHFKPIIFALLCTNWFVDALPLQTNSIKWVNFALNIPDVPGDTTFNPSVVDLNNSPSNLLCGQLDVPMDYSKPISASNNITLGLAVVQAQNSKGGALFFNPGVTDAGVLVAWEVALNLTNAFSGLENFDLVVMDVRGTYSSNQLNVSLDTFAGLSGSYPTNKSQYEAIQEASRMVIQSWVNNSSPVGIIEHVGTREVVQDYESIRNALGYDTINFLGASYGSYRAAHYALTYPDRVGRFVPDAVVPHGRKLFDQAQDSMAALDLAMLQVDAYCHNDSSCPFHAQGKWSVQNVFNEILVQAAQEPYKYCNDSDDCTSFCPSDIQSSMQNLLLISPDFPAILQGLNETISIGNVSVFGSSPPTVQDIVAMSLLCSDYSYNRSFATFNKSLSKGRKDDTSNIGMFQSWEIKLWCSRWEFSVPPNVPLPPTDTAMLLVTADFDARQCSYGMGDNCVVPPTPPSLSVMEMTMFRSLVVSMQTSTIMTKEFLNTGILPQAQSSALVSVYSPGTVRTPISDPYEVPTGAVAGIMDSGAIVEIPF